MDLNQLPRWRCSFTGENSEQCTKWAQKRRLCQRHFVQREQQQSLHAATELAGIINNDVPAPIGNITDNNDDDEQLIDAAPVQNVGNHTNNNDPPDVVDEQLNAAAPVENVGSW